jgi:hypothetical protein
LTIILGVNHVIHVVKVRCKNGVIVKRRPHQNAAVYERVFLSMRRTKQTTVFGLFEILEGSVLITHAATLPLT